MDDICIESKCLSGPKMSNDIVHREPHFALHYQSVGIKWVGVRGYHRARRPLPLKYLMEVARQRCGLEGLKRNVCQGRALSILRARVPAVPHQAPRPNTTWSRFADY